MSKFSEKLATLGFADYAAYLASDHWKGFKAAYRAGGNSCRCAVCGVGRVQLHHHTYKRLGAESFSDVTPLCRGHHVAVHEWLKTSGKVFVEFTHEAVAALGGTAAPRPGFVGGVPIGVAIRDGKRAKKKATKKKRKAAGRLADREAAFAPLEAQLIALHAEGFVSGIKLYRVREHRCARVAADLLAAALRRKESGKKIPPPAPPKQPRAPRPRVTEPFRLNDRPVPDRDTGEQKSRLRDILAARRKGV